MNIFSIIGIGLASAAIATVLRQYNKEYGLYISLGATVVIMSVILYSLEPVFSFINELTDVSDINTEYISVLIKSLAICYMIGIASDSCKDCGETAIASRIDFAGKIALLLITIPLFEAILDIIKELLNI